MEYTFSRKGKKGKFISDYGMHDAYKYFQNNYKCNYEITQREYSLIFKEVMERIMFKVIFESFDVKLPADVGNIRIKKTPIKIRFNPDGSLCTKGLRVDWKSTKDLWAIDTDAKDKKQLVFHFNEHTDRYNLKFYYDKRTSTMRNQSAYQFKVMRKWARLLNSAVKTNPNLNYYE